MVKTGFLTFEILLKLDLKLDLKTPSFWVQWFVAGDAAWYDTTGDYK